jgi:2-dehydro-3-deoxygluconokinase
MSVLTVGETMALLDPLEDGTPGAGTTFTLRLAGAESNVGIALARLGVDVTWISRLGADPFGDMIADALAAEGLSLRYVRRDPSRPTGAFFKIRGSAATSVVYYRAGSAASVLEPADVPPEALDGVELVHLTGITTALGEGPRALVTDVVFRAYERGVTVLFDPNFRSPLWTSPAAAAEAHRAFLPAVDWYLCGLEEGNALFGTSSVEELARAILDAGVGGTVVRVGARGAVVADRAAELVEVLPNRVEAVIDEVGAGDGFAAGFAYGLLQGWEAVRCARAGNLVAASALRGTGDWESYPYAGDIKELV